MEINQQLEFIRWAICKKYYKICASILQDFGFKVKFRRMFSISIPHSLYEMYVEKVGMKKVWVISQSECRALQALLAPNPSLPT